MIPYAKHCLTDADKAAVQRVLDSDRLTQGPMVERLEAKLCQISGAKYAVACSSGTAALHLAYLAAGLKPRMPLWCDPVSFVATSNAALYCGADVNFYDWGSCVDDCVVHVWLGGDPRSSYGSHYGVWFTYPLNALPCEIVDACHGPLAHWDFAKATCLSFHPCKHVAAGEGGAVLTNDIQVAAACRSMRDHGRKTFFRSPQEGAVGAVLMDCLGFNYRLDEMSAALAFSQLERYHENVERRREIAATYTRAFGERVHCVAHSAASARHLYQILVDDRDAVRHDLADRGIGTQVHYSPIIPLQPYYRQRFGYEPGQWPNAERYAARTLSIPLYPTLTDDEIQQVIDAILEVCGS